MQTWLPSPDPTPTDLTKFPAVPRKYRYDGWTVERQRAFIAELAQTGPVKSAARRINMSSEGAYYLRRQPGAEGFRAAWATALASGIQRLTDIAIDRAVEGIPVPVFHHGEQVGEKRAYNDRLLMFVMRHHLPAMYDARPLPGGTKNPETIAREAAENCPVCKARGEAEPNETEEKIAFLGEFLQRYDLKIAAERRHRLAGQIVAADFVLRQLTHIELVLDGGGCGPELLERYTTRPGDPIGGPVQINASPISQELDRRRRAIWAKAGDPPRPRLALGEAMPTTGLCGGPTATTREKARREAEVRMAEAQAVWEACASEETWARFTEASAP